MARKLLTREELMQMPDISPEDKDLIEVHLRDVVGSPKEDPTNQLRMAARGFLARLFIDLEPDEQARNDLGATVATFVDGWTWCKEHGQ